MNYLIDHSQFVARQKKQLKTLKRIWGDWACGMSKTPLWISPEDCERASVCFKSNFGENSVYFRGLKERRNKDISQAVLFVWNDLKWSTLLNVKKKELWCSQTSARPSSHFFVRRRRTRFYFWLRTYVSKHDRKTLALIWGWGPTPLQISFGGNCWGEG